MVEAILSYVIKAIDESSSVMDRIKGSIGLLGSSLSELGGGFSSVGTVMTGFAAGGVAGAAIGAVGELAKGLQSCMKEAASSEAVFTTLGAAVERSGTAWTTVADGTKKALLSMQATTTYSDEQLAAALERMLTFGMSYDQAMKALGATIDFAAAKHMDLESAATLVGKAVDGNTAIMKRYGVDITVAKDATDKFTPVLTQLNAQFGGAAPAAASTYVGLQERLKNATQEVGEKIGTILLPALASLTEGMLPVIDRLGKGVDAVSAWLTEVAKMPEVKGALDVLGGAFDGLMKYVSDLWQFFVTQLGPALTELMAAFKELSDALAPIGEAIGELRAAFGDTGDIDLFKILIMTVVVQIRAVADIIKAVAPYIKEFADGFKAAADFIGPILTQIVGAVRTFTADLRTIFQAFYTWLVGGSLWMDMWNAMLSVATEMIGRLLGALTSAFFAPMQAAFTSALQTVQTIWQTGWQTVQTTFTTAAGQIQGVLTNFGAAAQGIMTGIMGQLQGIVQGGVSAMIGSFNSLVGSAQSAIAQAQSLFQQAQQAIGNAMQQTAAVVKSGATTASNVLQGAYNAIASGASWLWNTLTGGSIWPEMMGEMVAITDETMAEIESRVLSGFATAVAAAQSANTLLRNIQTSIAGGAPLSAAISNAQAQAATAAASLEGKMGTATAGGYTYDIGIVGEVLAKQGYWNPNAPMNLSPQGMAQFGQALAEATEIASIQSGKIPASRVPDMYKQYIPVTVQVDGKTVAKTVEQRLVSQQQSAGGY